MRKERRATPTKAAAKWAGPAVPPAAPHLRRCAAPPPGPSPPATAGRRSPSRSETQNHSFFFLPLTTGVYPPYSISCDPIVFSRRPKGTAFSQELYWPRHIHKCSGGPALERCCTAATALPQLPRMSVCSAGVSSTSFDSSFWICCSGVSYDPLYSGAPYMRTPSVPTHCTNPP